MSGVRGGSGFAALADLRRRYRESRPVRWGSWLVALALLWIVPLLLSPASVVTDHLTTALAYVVMALGLNIVVGFAGLLDLGYLAFFAIGAYATGWFSSSFFANAGGGKGIHLFAESAGSAPGIHFNWVIVAICAAVLAALAGAIIGLPTLRLRGDYIAIVTLAFGEIIRVIAINGNHITFGKAAALTAGKQGITPIDPIDLPGLEAFGPLNLRYWYWTALILALIVLFVNYRLRDSRLGRAWIAIREDEVAASSMGVPLVRTKLAAYGTGAAFGGIAGAFLASYLNTVNADQFDFSFSILVLAMIILGGLGSIAGVVVGAIGLSLLITWFIPDGPHALGIHIDLTQYDFAIYGCLLLLMMVLRPAGLIPERRRQIELEEGVGTDEALYEARA